MARREPLDVAQRRLHSQSLDAPRFDRARDVVAWLGAVQCQDYAAGKWALGLRTKDATDASIEEAFNSGSILRTHVMRPTWHFVLPENIRWLLELTAPRVRAILAPYDRKHFELTQELLSRCRSVFAKALRSSDLTRDELAQHLERSGIDARGQRLAHIVMHSELDGLICSGPRRGKQFTYALMSRRVPEARKVTRDEARAKLALSYFTSHGPAQIKDFAWWSGLTVKDATDGLNSVQSKLVRETLAGKTYWSSPARAPRTQSPAAHLVSIYDEYTIAYRDRSALGDERVVEKLSQFGNALTAVLILDGKIAGTWKRTIRKGAVEVVVQPLRKLTRAENDAIAEAARRYGAFLDMRVEVKELA